MDYSKTRYPILNKKDREKDQQESKPMMTVDIATGKIEGGNIYKEVVRRMEKPKNRAEEVREMLPMDKLEAPLKEKSRLEPEQQEPVTMLEVKECQCTPDAEILRELSDLRDEVEWLKLIASHANF